MATAHHDAALQAAAKRLEVAQRNKASIKAQVPWVISSGWVDGLMMFDPPHGLMMVNHDGDWFHWMII